MVTAGGGGDGGGGRITGGGGLTTGLIGTGGGLNDAPPPPPDGERGVGRVVASGSEISPASGGSPPKNPAVKRASDET
jgi:hypothetical protein